MILSILELNIDNIDDNILKEFWIINNKEEANDKISELEWSKLKSRELTNNDIYKLKKERAEIKQEKEELSVR